MCLCVHLERERHTQIRIRRGHRTGLPSDMAEERENIQRVVVVVVAVLIVVCSTQNPLSPTLTPPRGITTIHCTLLLVFFWFRICICIL